MQGTRRKRSAGPLTEGRFGILYLLPHLFSVQHGPADAGPAAHRVPRMLSSCRLGPVPVGGRPPLPAATTPSAAGPAYLRFRPEVDSCRLCLGGGSFTSTLSLLPVQGRCGGKSSVTYKGTVST